ncbi:MAG: type II toxin-antitoxin system HicB family antitoxin [Vulcanimicrobiaceae bacterium]
MPMRVRDALRHLAEDGWVLVVTRGSHRQFKHPTKAGRVTVPGREGDELKVEMKYPVIIERGEQNFSAYVPDLPGCVSTGATLEETQENIREAIELHLEGMREDRIPIPPPSSVTFAEVA